MRKPRIVYPLIHISLVCSYWGLALCTQPIANATTFAMPQRPGDAFLGNPEEPLMFVAAEHDDTLLDIAREYDIGQNEILLANPDVDRWIPGDQTRITIPNSHLLPDTPHKGLVLNLPEFRLYYYHSASKNQPATVSTHPISIGRVDWQTPLGQTKIVAKTENPVWIPPESIKQEHAAEGDILPNIVPAGPNNPLGLFALRLAIPGYLIHSTNKPFGVGMRVSHGCIRMYPEDIERVYPEIPIGTPVYIVNQPIKVGWLDNLLYIEVHPDLEDAVTDYQQKLDIALDLIEKNNNGKLPVLDGEKFRKALTESNGMPVSIFKRNEIFEETIKIE